MIQTFANRNTGMKLAWRILLYALIFLISWLAFNKIAKLDAFSDFKIHNQIIRELLEGKYGLPPHFLYFILVMLAVGFSPELTCIVPAAAAILSIAVVMKFHITGNFLQQFYPESGFKKYQLLLALGLLFLTNMPNKPWWNQLPLSWHNSTTIFLFPFAIWFFMASYDFLQTGHPSKLWTILIVGVLTLFIKPNFILSVTLVYPFLVLHRFRFSRITWMAAFCFLTFILVLAGQYFYTYHFLSAHEMTQYYNHVEIVVSPFDAWGRISDNRFVSFLSWTLFPSMYFLLRFRNAIRSLLYNYASFLFLSGFIMFILFAEREGGKNIAAVNFIWQVIICHYIWFMVSLVLLIRDIQIKAKLDWKDILLLAVAMAYLLSGVLYAIRSILLG